MEPSSTTHRDPLLIENGDLVAGAVIASAATMGCAGVPIQSDTALAVAEAMNQDLPDMSLEQSKTKRRANRSWTAVVVGVSLGAMLMGMLAIWIEWSVVAFVAFSVPIVTSPYVIYQRRQINRLPTFVHALNKTRGQVNRLSKQNSIFKAETDRLEGELDRLREMENQLSEICQKTGNNVGDLLGLIEENRTLQKSMKKILDAKELQDVFAAILRSDSDGNFELSEDEMDRLMLRLRSFNVADKERLKETLRSWTAKPEENEWDRLDIEDTRAGSVTGLDGWVV